MPKKDISYWALYLKRYLTEEDDPRKDDDAFIDARAELAAATMEETRLKEGLTVNQAEERAIAVLMEGF
ncbi:MAG: DUF1896 family protein [Prevotella sp.]|nr:DUF1896 family protein [Prevotella sp.]MBR3078247.1 DUF1896 family protein [Prevotella sp.]